MSISKSFKKVLCNKTRRSNTLGGVVRKKIVAGTSLPYTSFLQSSAAIYYARSTTYRTNNLATCRVGTLIKNEKPEPHRR